MDELERFDPIFEATVAGTDVGLCTHENRCIWPFTGIAACHNGRHHDDPWDGNIRQTAVYLVQRFLAFRRLVDMRDPQDGEIMVFCKFDQGLQGISNRSVTVGVARHDAQDGVDHDQANIATTFDLIAQARKVLRVEGANLPIRIGTTAENVNTRQIGTCSDQARYHDTLNVIFRGPEDDVTSVDRAAARPAEIASATVRYARHEGRCDCGLS